MSTGELAYLSMVIVAFVVFAAVLAWVSRRAPPMRERLDLGRPQRQHAHP